MRQFDFAIIGAGAAAFTAAIGANEHDAKTVGDQPRTGVNVANRCEFRPHRLCGT